MRSISSFLLVGVVLVFAFSLLMCGEDDNPVQSNNSPATPVCGSPVDGATDVLTTAALAWSCTDPDGDALTYDVYFGTAATPPEVSNGQLGTNYSPGALDYSTQYYWRIVATDVHGATTGSDTWSFTTIEEAVCEVTVTAPTAGEEWRVGDEETITWTTNHSSDNVKIELFKSGILAGTIESVTPEDGSQQWVVDDFGGGSGTDYSIKVTDAADADCYDYSEDFEIDAGPWTVLLNPDADASVNSLTPDYNEGDASVMYVGVVLGAPTWDARSYIRFDLSGIQSGAVLEDATLRIYVRSVMDGPFDVSLGACSDSWAEMEVTFNDFIGVHSSDQQTATFDDPDEDAYKDIDVTDLVEEWLAGRSNYGFWFGAGEQGDISVYSREGSYPPILDITYAVP